MNKTIIGLVMLFSLCACSNVTKETLGLGKNAPDEFMVTTRPPLSLPPEYDLRPVSEVRVEQEEISSLDEVFARKIEE